MRVDKRILVVETNARLVTGGRMNEILGGADKRAIDNRYENSEKYLLCRKKFRIDFT